MFTNSLHTNVPYFLSPVGNGKQDSVCKHTISPLCTTAEANAKNVNKGEHFEAYGIFTLAALLVGCPNSRVQKL
jgi:hypothetical protein